MLVPRDGGKDRVLGEVKLCSHSLREQPPEYPQGWQRMSLGLCSLHELASSPLQTPGLFGSSRRRFTPARPGNMHYAHVSVALVEADRLPDYVRKSTAV